MPNQFYLQNNFSHGELDPRLFAGTNLTYYYKSLKKARNVYVRPQGGIKRRHGTKYLQTVTADAGEYKMSSFIFNSDTRFVLIFQPLEIVIYQILADGDLSNDFTVVTVYTADQVPDLQFAQNGNLMIIVHPDVAPQQLIWDDASQSWNIDATTPGELYPVPIKNPPVYDFAKNYYSSTFTISPVTIGKSATLTCSTAVFLDPEYVDGVFISLGAGQTEPIGFARIKSITSPTVALVDIIFPFDTSLTTATPGIDCFLGVPAISVTHGWPGSVAFYEDRLCLAATDELPQTLYLSKIGSFNDFSQGDSSDDDAIISTLSTSDFNKIKYLISDKTLQIFCSESTFSSVQTFDEPLTPSSASFRKQVAYGISDTKPLLIDNSTYFVREGGKAVMGFIFNPDSNSYAGDNASIFSSNLIGNPIGGAVLKGDDSEDADYMFLINEDGTLLTFQILSGQDISAWTISVTGPDHVTLDVITPTHSKFKDMVNVQNKIYTIVERIIEAVPVRMLELLSFDYFTDSSVFSIHPHDTNVVGGLSHLNGEKVRVVGDGNVLRVDNDVNGGLVTNGEITLLDSAKVFKTGLNFNLLAETVPANVVGQGRLYVPKKIVRMFVDYYESVAIKVNGEFIPELAFGENVLDQPAKLGTGVFTTRGLNWDPRVTIQITQEDPVPFLVIGLGFEVTL